jgi:hypothetical protein
MTKSHAGKQKSQVGCPFILDNQLQLRQPEQHRHGGEAEYLEMKH